MRLIGDFDNESAAMRFTDFLTAQEISARILHRGASWAVWARHDSQLEEARRFLAAFQASPDDPQFVQPAQKIRAQRDAAVAAAQQSMSASTRVIRIPTLREVSRRAPLTSCLIWLAMLVALFTDFGTNLGGIAMQSLAFSNPASSVTEDVASDASPAGMRDIREGEVWRLWTPILLHFGWIHFAFCIFLFFQFGWMLETGIGTERLGLIVAVTALAGNLAEYLITGRTLFGGLMCVVSGLLVFVWVRMRWAPENGLRIADTPAILLLFLFVLGFSGAWDGMIQSSEFPDRTIANWSHLFGGVAGGLLAVALPRRRDVLSTERL